MGTKRKLVSQPNPAFVKAIKNGLAHWTTLTVDLEAESIKELDPQKENLFQILDYGLQLPELWQPTAELMVQVFPLPDRGGYWNLWLKKLKMIIAYGPQMATPTLARLYLNYGKLFRHIWQLDEAKKAHHIAMKYAKNLEDDHLLANVLMELAWDYLWGNELDDSQKVGENALQIYELKQNAPKVYLVDTMRVLGFVETRRGNFDQAVRLLKRALLNAKKIKTPIVLARTYINLGIAYQRKGDVLEAMDYYGKASEVLLNTSYEGEKFHVFLNIGTLYFDQEKWDAAEAAFQMVNSRYLRESGDLINLASLWNNLGNVYCKQGKLDIAEKYLQDALKVWAETKNELEWANTMASLAEVFVLQIRFAEAEKIIEAAKEKVENYPENDWAKEIGRELQELTKQTKEGKRISGLA